MLIANDDQAYRDIRAHLADNRMSLPLFDNVRFSAELADLFGRMAARWKKGLPPAALAAEPLASPAVATSTESTKSIPEHAGA